LEEHAEELEAIENNALPQPLPAEVIAKRKRRFWPYAIVMTILLTAGLIRFLTLEDTAIKTVPRQDIVVFAPEITLEVGDASVGESMWPTLRCARCHGDTAAGGKDAPALRGTNLSFEVFFHQVRVGKTDKMPAFSAGEVPDAYLLHLWTWLKQKPTATPTAGSG